MILVCEVCQGRGAITLPLHHSLSPEVSTELVRSEDSSKTFPCPQCQNYISEEQVSFFQCNVSVSARDLNENTLDAVTHSAAKHLVKCIMEKGLMCRERYDGNLQTVEFKMTVGVVAPAIVASMHERINGGMLTLANEIVQLGSNWIETWGYGDYGKTGSIPKFVAVDNLKRAARKAVARLSSFRSAEKLP